MSRTTDREHVEVGDVARGVRKTRSSSLHGRSSTEKRSDEPRVTREAADQGERVLTPAAERALAEAEARRNARAEAGTQTEIGGRDGPDPARYGDWEKNGIASDF